MSDQHVVSQTSADHRSAGDGLVGVYHALDSGRMAEVSVRDLRNHGGDVLDDVRRGQTVIVTRSGKPVTELRPLGRQGTPTAELLRRWRHVPRISLSELRADLDDILDPSL